MKQRSSGQNGRFKESYARVRAEQPAAREWIAEGGGERIKQSSFRRNFPVTGREHDGARLRRLYAVNLGGNTDLFVPSG